MERVLGKVKQLGLRHGLNVVAFSGGVDSSVVAACTQRAFPGGQAIAVIGVSPALPARQLEQARDQARDVGVELIETPTDEWRRSGYVENRGRSCYHCKTTLYETLARLGEREAQARSLAGVRLFNGTNLDDLRDATRVGLQAADEFGVVSPLAELGKDAVRAAARELGLRTAEVAASPCLRSRLAFGVEAVRDHLALVETAEEVLRRQHDFDEASNLRFRLLAGGRYRVEVDRDRLDAVAAGRSALARAIGLDEGRLEVKEFRSGSVAQGNQTP